MSFPVAMLRGLLGGLAVFDLVLGATSVFAPGAIADLLWTGADAGALALLRRTGALWLAFAAAEAMAWRSPGKPERLRLVAFLRWMDVPADAIWLACAGGVTTLGWIAIGAAPLLNFSFGVVLWRAAARAAGR